MKKTPQSEAFAFIHPFPDFAFLESLYKISKGVPQT
jgi:hypothetical protein